MNSMQIQRGTLSEWREMHSKSFTIFREVQEIYRETRNFNLIAVIMVFSKVTFFFEFLTQ